MIIMGFPEDSLDHGAVRVFLWDGSSWSQRGPDITPNSPVARTSVRTMGYQVAANENGQYIAIAVTQPSANSTYMVFAEWIGDSYRLIDGCAGAAGINAEQSTYIQVTSMEMHTDTSPNPEGPLILAYGISGYDDGRGVVRVFRGSHGSFNGVFYSNDDIVYCVYSEDPFYPLCSCAGFRGSNLGLINDQFVLSGVDLIGEPGDNYGEDISFALQVNGEEWIAVVAHGRYVRVSRYSNDIADDMDRWKTVGGDIQCDARHVWLGDHVLAVGVPDEVRVFEWHDETWNLTHTLPADQNGDAMMNDLHDLLLITDATTRSFERRNPTASPTASPTVSPTFQIFTGSIYGRTIGPLNIILAIFTFTCVIAIVFACITMCVSRI